MGWSAVVGSALTAAPLLLALEASAGPTAGPGLHVQKRDKAAPARLETFLGSLEEAQVSAYDRNVPLLVISILEDPAADVVTFRNGVLTDPRLARGSELAVVLLANNGLHPLEEVTEEVDGVEVTREVCSVYASASCSDHQKPFDDVYNAFHVDGELLLPFVAVMTPDRVVRDRYSDGHAPSLDTVLKAFEVAQRETGEGLTVAQLAVVRAMLTRGEKQLADGAFGDAHRSYAAVLETTQATRYADTAREETKKALAGLEAWRDGALAQLEAGEVIAGYQSLLDLEAASTATPLEEEIPKLRKQVERDKRFREELAAYKREVEARAIYAEAERLFREGEDKKAASKVRQLLRKYEGTEAAAEAKKRWPDL